MEQPFHISHLGETFLETLYFNDKTELTIQGEHTLLLGLPSVKANRQTRWDNIYCFEAATTPVWTSFHNVGTLAPHLSVVGLLFHNRSH